MFGYLLRQWGGDGKLKIGNSFKISQIGPNLRKSAQGWSFFAIRSDLPNERHTAV
jgi:hypothetical protein